MKKLFFTLFVLCFGQSLLAQNCDFDINALYLNCDHSFQFYIEIGEYEYSSWYELISYDWGDDSENQVWGAELQHVYEPGNYTITATILQGECEGMTLSYDLQVGDCSCPEGIEVGEPIANSQCSSYVFELENFPRFLPEGALLEWNFGDGTTAESESFESAYHGYEEEGTYTVIANYTSPNCPDGAVLSLNIDVEFCEESCLEMDYFYLDNFNTSEPCEAHLVLDDNGTQAWYVNGDYVGEGYDVNAVMEDGLNDVCLVLEPAENCPLGMEECIEVEFECEDECGLTLNHNPSQLGTDCEKAGLITAVDFPLDAEFQWSVNGVNQEFEFTSYFQYYFNDPGSYLICFSYTSELCEYFSDCILLEVEDCNEDCELEIGIEEYSCGHYGLFAYPSEDVLVSWFIDDEFFATGNELDWDPEDGNYEVCAVFETSECPQGVWVCQPYEVDCSNDCELEISVEEYSCGHYGLFAYPSEDVLVSWFIDDEFFATGNELDWDPEDGNYEVCAVFETSECPQGVWACQPYEVDCSNDCELEIGIENWACGTYALFAFVGDDVIVDWYINEEYYNSGNGLDWGPENGDYIVCAHYVTEACPEGVEACLEYVVDCEEECELDISWLEEGCGYVSLMAVNHPDNANLFWEINDEYVTNDEEVITYYFSEDGPVDVCVFYETPECPLGAYECVQINGETCEDCPPIEFQSSWDECDNQVVWAEIDGAVAAVDWFIDGEFYENSTIFHPNLGEDAFTFNLCAAYETEECPLGMEACFGDVYYHDCGPDCYEVEDVYVGNVGTECLVYEFEIGSSQDDLSVYWDFGDGSDWQELGHYAEHEFPEPGTYVVTINYNSQECDDNLFVLVEVGCPEDCPDVTFEIEYIDCQQGYFYSVADNFNTIQTDWYVDGLYIESGDWFWYTFEIGGMHQVCSVYESENCSEITENCYTFDIEWCEEECPTTDDINPSAFPGSCLNWEFVLESNDQNAEVLWNFGDEMEEWGGLYVQHEYDEPGVYLISATYYSNTCPDGIELLQSILVEDCDGCPDIQLNTEFIYCGQSMFYSTLLGDSFSTDWYVDGEYVETTDWFEYNFETEGNHTICSVYETEECPDGVENCIDVDIDLCDGDCELEVEHFEISCEYYNFVAYVSDDEYTVSWLYDGEFLENGLDVNIPFPTEGYHTICAIYETPDCPLGIEYCEQFYIDYDDCNCTDVVIAIDMDPSLTDIYQIPWSLYNETTQEIVDDGTCLYNKEEVYCDIQTCLPDGCYHFTLYSFTGEFDDGWENIFSNVVGPNGEIEIYNVEAVQNGCFLSYDFSINSDCDQPDCELEIFGEELNSDAWIFESQAPENAEIFWSVSNGDTYVGSVFNYEFNEPGVYEICAQYETPDCPLGASDCMTVIIEEESCSEVVIAISSEISEFELELLEFYLESEGFGVEGDVPLTSISGELELTYCLPNGCYELGIAPEDGVLNLINLEISVYVNGDWVASLEDLQNSDEGTLEFGVNSDCDTSISEEMIQSIGLFPNPINNGEVSLNLGDLTKAETIEVYDFTGKLVHSQAVRSTLERINIDSWSAGIYQIVLHGDFESISKKLIVTK